MRLTELEAMVGEELAEQMVREWGGKVLPAYWELEKKGRDNTVWGKWVNGKTIVSIAKEMRIGVQTVNRILKRKRTAVYQSNESD